MSFETRTINAAKLNKELKETFAKVVDKFTSALAAQAKEQNGDVLIGAVSTLFQVNPDASTEGVHCKISVTVRESTSPKILAALELAELEALLSVLGDGGVDVKVLRI